MSFESAQRLYDQQEPPLEYEWDDCMTYGAILGDLDGETIYGPDKCPSCPMKHRCKDGVMVITSLRNEAITMYIEQLIGI